jgi:predicted nucleic acid-binding protein
MKVFIDTNVLLDVFLNRPGLVAASAAVWELAEKESIQGIVSAISFNNIHYIATKYHSKDLANQAMSSIRNCFKTVDMTMQIINQSIDAQWKDFEDAIQYFSALHADADYIVTRNSSDFPREGIAIMTPEDFISFSENKLFNHD